MHYPGYDVKLLAYPKYTNPYQELLYGALTKARPDFQRRYLRTYPLVWPLFLPLALLYFRFKGYTILHIHWQNFGIGVPRFAAGRAFRYLAARSFLIAARALRFRIVWTVHNVAPHETLTSNDEELARVLSRTADAKIVHSSGTVLAMEALGLDVHNIAVIPHGNYIGVYKDDMNKESARSHLGIDDSDFVILFFGLVRKYKGVDRLVTLFSEMAIPETRLVIAGECFDSGLRSELEAATKSSPIDLHAHRIADDSVGLYFKACDVVCIPFRSVTTSGSALLALSFGRPIIAPLDGALADLPGDVGFLYERDDVNGLRNSVAKAIEQREGLEGMGKSAREYAETLAWDKIAEDTYSVYESVVRGHAVGSPRAS